MSKKIKCFLRKKAKKGKKNNLYSIKNELNLLHNESFLKQGQIIRAVVLSVVFFFFSTLSILYFKKIYLFNQDVVGDNFIVSSFHEYYFLILILFILISIICLFFLIKTIYKLIKK